ncbi:DNA-binding protein [Pseudomonas xantholysinigenes]|uniref:DNA-binding protein n=1 Tax=Pseudomonas xantholysinigenes TaxID=2745490 RepID=A0A9E6U0I0_9PSED|nr:DNA-binding protein [Pseudomonas xantholysinigenes]QXI40941.1 DNA-binding protein [Pseudomonas xantholysinigenes]
MARAGIGRAVVEQARDALLARGVHPSIDAVRIELGNTGSKTTIHRYLRELGRQPMAALESTACLSEPLGKLVEQLASQLHAEGQARVEAAEAALNQQREQLQAQLALAQRALAAAQQQNEAQARQLTAAQERVQAEQLRSASLQQALGEVQVRLADKDNQIRSLEDKHHDARQALELYRTQREQEQRRIDTQVRQLQGQLQTLQQGALVYQQESTRLNRDNERLLAEQRQALAQRATLEQQLEQRDAQVQGLRAMLAQAQGASEEMRRRLAACEQGPGTLERR